MPSRPCRSLAAVVTTFVLVSGSLTASATAATSPTPVYLDQPGLSEAMQPSSFRLADYESADSQTLANSAVSGVSWSSWGGTTAEGSGQALVQWTDASTGLHAQERATVPVVVSASGLRSCGGVSVYSSLVIDPAPEATARALPAGAA